MKRTAILVTLLVGLPLSVFGATYTGSWGANYGDCTLSTTSNSARGTASWYKESGHSYAKAGFTSKTGSATKYIQVRGKCYVWNSFGYGYWRATTSHHRACSKGAGGGSQPYASSCRIKWSQ